MNKIGIIGGSGLEKPDILQNPEYVTLQTKYGEPSSKIITGKIARSDIAIISRHGFEHKIPPHNINNAANIIALKELGCTHIIATTACGSLREQIKRGDIVFPDQFIDFTKNRRVSLFDEFPPGEMKHTPMAKPFDEHLRSSLISIADQQGITYHKTGTVVTIEGPRFSTKAESHMYRQWGADIINMSTAPECIIANEAEIPYASIAMSTDYDCWKEDENPVSWEEVIEVFNNNVDKVIQLISKALSQGI
ncbi:MAG: S-methyl-5'-thioadenosine phosphorylase [Marinilabiliales bacterium]|nr:MAG: S-methyl-5'-thioadenosine phosphorylase [Marinilabiliales bacterium]